jgi:hypothetical protein
MRFNALRWLTAAIAFGFALQIGVASTPQLQAAPSGDEAPADENEQLATLAENLVELRSQVDELASELSRNKEISRRELRSVSTQIADAERRLHGVKTQIEGYERRIADQKEKVRLASQQAEDLKPAVLTAIESVRDSARARLPFKKEERLAALDELERQLEQGLLSPQRVTARLWKFVADEIRLTSESGLYRQVIELKDGEVLADVIRVGMITMFFQTDDGRTGFMRRDERNWRWLAVDEPAARDKIRALFTSFQKGIRVGYFTLPNFLPAEDQ